MAPFFEAINKIPMTFAPAVTTVFVLGIFWKRGTRQAAMTTLYAGSVLGIIYFVMDLKSVGRLILGATAMPGFAGLVTDYHQGLGIPFMLAGPLLAALCIVIYIITSLLTPVMNQEDVRKVCWEHPPSFLKGRITGMNDPRIVALILAVVVSALYFCLKLKKDNTETRRSQRSAEHDSDIHHEENAMVPAREFFGLSVLLIVAAMAAGCSRPPVRRVGMVIGIKSENIAAYKALHADSNPGARDLLSKYHRKNFTIYLRQLEGGRYYLFGYYEYDGSDYQGDMARLAAEQRNKNWLSVTDPMQIPLPGQRGWATMEEVYHNP